MVCSVFSKLSGVSVVFSVVMVLRKLGLFVLIGVLCYVFDRVVRWVCGRFVRV